MSNVMEEFGVIAGDDVIRYDAVNSADDIITHA
jgi:hypothetical protein